MTADNETRYPDGAVMCNAKRLTLPSGSSMDVLAMTDTESGQRMYLNASELRDLADFLDRKIDPPIYAPTKTGAEG